MTRRAVAFVSTAIASGLLAMTASPPPHYPPEPTPNSVPRSTPEPAGIDWPVAYGRKAVFL